MRYVCSTNHCDSDSDLLSFDRSLLDVDATQTQLPSSFNCKGSVSKHIGKGPSLRAEVQRGRLHHHTILLLGVSLNATMGGELNVKMHNSGSESK